MIFSAYPIKIIQERDRVMLRDVPPVYHGPGFRTLVHGLAQLLVFLDLSASIE